MSICILMKFYFFKKLLIWTKIPQNNMQKTYRVSQRTLPTLFWTYVNPFVLKWTQNGEK